MLGAEDPLAVGEQRLEDRDRIVDTPRRPIGEREVMACGQCVGVLDAEDSPMDRQKDCR